MKNYMKKLGFALIGATLTFAVLTAAPAKARAISQADLEVAQLLRGQAAEKVFGSNSKALTLFYVGSATEAVVSITSGAIRAEAPANVPDTSNFGISVGSYTFSNAAYNTLGELCDAIDALANYECKLEGGLRTDLSSATLRLQTGTSGTCDLKAAGGCTIKLDQIDRLYDISLGLTPAVGKRITLKTCTTNNNVIGTTQVFGRLRRYEGFRDLADRVPNYDEAQVVSEITADDTDLTIPTTLTQAGWMTFAKDAHVVIRTGNGGSVQAAANFAGCQWFEE